MSQTNNKITFLRHFEEVLNQGILDVVDEIYAVDYVLHAPGAGGDTHGWEQLKARVTAFRTGIPDIHFFVDQILAEIDSVMVRYTFRGTHTGTFAGIPATGRTLCVPGIIVVNFVEGGIQEGWSSFDSGDMLRQLGIE